MQKEKNKSQKQKKTNKKTKNFFALPNQDLLLRNLHRVIHSNHSQK